MISAISGNAVTGIASGNISGRVAIDGAAPAVCAGPVIEDAGGQYHLNAFVADLAGYHCGFYFTASGCVPVSLQAITTNTWPQSGSLVNSGTMSGQPMTLLSGRSFTASGISTVGTVYSGMLSGQVVDLNSGQSWFGSGQSVLIYSGQLSGQPMTLLSGRSYPASGVFTVASIASGTSVLATLYSGSLSGQVVDLNSGQSWLGSGNLALVYSGQLSGQPMTLLSGRSFPASGVFTVAAGASGASVIATLYSGSLSGQVVDLNSGQSWLGSGQSVLVYSGQLSGQVVDLTSGQSFPASGVGVIGTLYSGTVNANSFNSGTFNVSLPYAVLKADTSGVTGEALHSLVNAARKLINKWSISGTTLTVFKEDGTSTAYTQAAVVTSGSQPVTALG